MSILLQLFSLLKQSHKILPTNCYRKMRGWTLCTHTHTHTGARYSVQMNREFSTKNFRCDHQNWTYWTQTVEVNGVAEATNFEIVPKRIKFQGRYFDWLLDCWRLCWQTARKYPPMMSHSPLCRLRNVYTPSAMLEFLRKHPTSAATPLLRWRLSDPLNGQVFGENFCNWNMKWCCFWSNLLLKLTAYSSCILHWLNSWPIESFTLMMFSVLLIEVRSL